MSYVTSITIVVDYASKEFETAVTAPNTFGRDDLPGFNPSLKELDRMGAGGSKVMGHHVYAAGINYADREALWAFVDALPWNDVVNGVVMVSVEGEFQEFYAYGVGPRWDKS